MSNERMVEHGIHYYRHPWFDRYWLQNGCIWPSFFPPSWAIQLGWAWWFEFSHSWIRVVLFVTIPSHEIVYVNSIGYLNPKTLDTHQLGISSQTLQSGRNLISPHYTLCHHQHYHPAAWAAVYVIINITIQVCGIADSVMKKMKTNKYNNPLCNYGSNAFVVLI